MKRIYLSIMCITALTLLGACGDNKKSNSELGISTGNEKVDEIVEKAFTDMSGIEKFKSVLKDAYHLNIGDISPAFEYAEQNAKGKDYFFGEEAASHNVVGLFAKKDGSDITKDEYKAYVKKVYDLMKKKSQDGKLIVGFDGGAETKDDALKEKTFDKLFEEEYMPQDFCLRMNDEFYVCSMSLEEARGEAPMRIKFNFYRGLQKSFGDSMKDAEKMLDDPEVKKVLKEELAR